MTGDFKRRRPEDPDRINIDHEWELEYWADKFGISQEEVITAVRTVGVLIYELERYLGSEED